MTRSLQEHPNDVPGRWLRNTAELSGELSVGDVVTVTADGQVGLAVAKTGWALIPGPLAEVRTSQHGTRPLPPAGEPTPEPRQENHGE